MKDIILIIGLIGASFCAVLVLELFARAPLAVAGTVLVYAGLTTIFTVDFRLAFGSITVYPPDIIFALVGGAALVRFLGLPRLSFAHIALLALTGLALFSVCRGAVTDVASAVNEFRSMFYFLSGALYFVTVAPTKTFLDGATRWFYAGALLTLLGTLILWSEFLTGVPLPEVLADPWEGGFRVVTASKAMILAQAALIALPAWLSRNRTEWRFERFLPIILIPAVFLLQWRVVWIAFVVALCVMGVKNRTLGMKLLVPILATLAASVFLLPKVFSGDDAPSLSDSFETTTETAEGTLLWRVEGWSELAEDGPRSGSEVVLGAPYGRGLERVIADTEVTSQAHSFYLDHYLRLGLLGLVVLVLLYAWLVRRLVSLPGGPSPGLSNPTVLLAVVVTQLINFITFTPGPVQGVVAGIALGFAARAHSRDAAVVPAPEPEMAVGSSLAAAGELQHQ